MAKEAMIAREGGVASLNAEKTARAAKREAERNRARKYILDELSIVSSRFNDPQQVSVEITPKKNFRIWYGDYDTGLTVGSLRGGITRTDLRKYGLIKKF